MKTGSIAEPVFSLPCVAIIYSSPTPPFCPAAYRISISIKRNGLLGCLASQIVFGVLDNHKKGVVLPQ
jgi:hypothetical protein